MAQTPRPLQACEPNTKTPASIISSHSFKSSSAFMQNYSTDLDIENRIEILGRDSTYHSSRPIGMSVDYERQWQRSKSRSPTKQMNSSMRQLSSSQSIRKEESGDIWQEEAIRSLDEQEYVPIDPEEHKASESEVLSPQHDSSNFGDDTLLSNFSAVPNMDMTQFARLGQLTSTSPSKSRSDSPTKSTRSRPRTPGQSRPTTPGTANRSRPFNFDEDRSPSPTPRGPTNREATDDTTNLMDFTAQFNAIGHQSSAQHVRARSISPRKPNYLPSRSATQQNGRPHSPSKATISTPRHLSSLLDFDIPPAPTPRSIPSVTVREHEAMRSTFQSRVSSLQASLDGRDSEIKSLKAMKESAEGRMGEVLEEVRDLRDGKAVLMIEKQEWERREREMQSLLKTLREELIRGEGERRDMLERATKAEMEKDDVERRLADIIGAPGGNNNKIRSAGSQDAKSATTASDSASDSGTLVPDDNASEVSGTVAGDTLEQTPGLCSTAMSATTERAVQTAVDRVARELHTLYKSKHESKVLALKKSYEARWEKRVRELTAQLEDARKEAEDLRLGRDATLSSVLPSNVLPKEADQQQEKDKEEERERREAELEAEMHKQRDTYDQRIHAQEELIASLDEELKLAKNENTNISADLEDSRSQLGALIASVDEMLLVQSQQPQQPPLVESQPESQPLRSPQPSRTLSSTSGLSRPLSTSTTTRSASETATTTIHNPRVGGMPKVSGLKGPGFSGAGESRIGMIRAPGSTMGRTASGSSTGSGIGSRSGIMSNIERMGRGGGGKTGE
ncbi:hypothetical protein MMC25_004439 [Agyrium rufum]|nr:hypothetical protein [Agyrium rufum]